MFSLKTAFVLILIRSLSSYDIGSAELFTALKLTYIHVNTFSQCLTVSLYYWSFPKVNDSRALLEEKLARLRNLSKER